MVMNEYFANHEEMKPFRDYGPRNQEPLGEILDGKLAEGNYGMSIQSLREAQTRLAIASSIEEEETEENIDLSVENSPLASNNVPDSGQASSRLMTPIQLGKRSASNTLSTASESQKKKSKPHSMAEIFHTFGEQMENSRSKYVVGKAGRSFLAELKELFPEEWRNEKGQIPYRVYKPILKILKRTEESEMYLAMKDEASIENRRDWVLSQLTEE